MLAVKDESAEDTLLDLANYCLLMAAYLREKRDKKMVEGELSNGALSAVR
jgi:hypothetical protein